MNTTDNSEIDAKRNMTNWFLSKAQKHFKEGKEDFSTNDVGTISLYRQNPEHGPKPETLEES